MPRQTRRSRNQAPTLRKGQQPAVPAHFYRRTPAPTLEPEPGSEQQAGAPDIDSAALPAEPEAAVHAASSPAPAAGMRSRPVSARQPAAPRIAVTDYGYVIGEVTRIFTIAAIIIVLLIVIAILRH
ncbi:MAG TPA: hypothetical protein VFD32_00630 [Dehalococcoidia bacterium]|nr:hypothetical protein [Dehalococcoidia bacterium]